jgi:hypothetical protein
MAVHQMKNRAKRGSARFPSIVPPGITPDHLSQNTFSSTTAFDDFFTFTRAQKRKRFPFKPGNQSGR